MKNYHRNVKYAIVKILYIKYSILSGENNHTKEFLIENIEVCPICKNTPISICNYIQQTKTCKNKHSWMRCIKCKLYR